MANNNLFTGFLGVLIVLGLIVLIVIESTTPERVDTVTKTTVLPVPYPRRRYHRRRPYYPPYIPGRVVGDRSNPFCAHTAHGCYPGTTTPIP
jgi:hypothetical protein